MDEYFRDGGYFNAKLTYSLETKPMNTAGAVKNAEAHLTSERFFVLNGDVFTDLDLSAMLKFHLENKAKVTIALTPVEDPPPSVSLRPHLKAELNVSWKSLHATRSPLI